MGVLLVFLRLKVNLFGFHGHWNFK